jgi:hypothetical protein
MVKMGTYNQSGEEIEDEFEKWLDEASSEGDISAGAIAKAWNHIAKKHKWSDRLVAFDASDLKAIIRGEQ